MDLKQRINSIINHKKFDNLRSEQKEIVEQCIFAHCLILSPNNQERYLKTIEESVVSINDLGNERFYSNENCYDGIVRTKIEKDPKDVFKVIKNLKMIKSEKKSFFKQFMKKGDAIEIPLKYEVHLKQFDLPLNRLTRSYIHELGHVVVKNKQVDNNNTILDKNGILKISLGGLVINNEFKEGYGNLLQEIINEYTTFLAFKAHMAYGQYEANKKLDLNLIKDVTKMNLSFEDERTYLDILPDNIFTSYAETDLANSEEFEMFNEIYVRYTPLIKLIMNSFQNPRFSCSDLKKEFMSGNGLSATKDGEPINDLLYGYYESSFRPLEIFNDIMSDKIDWETLCKEFDSEMYNDQLNTELINRYITIFQDFYEKRNTKYLLEGRISKQQYNQNLEKFFETIENCKEYYKLRVL